MSFILKSVELKNIRTHEYLLFEPAESGITAITGETGAGKSTIVDAFAWALYGTRPSGVKNKNLIKDNIDPKDKPVSVKVNLILGGISYLVERKIINKTGTTECNVWAKTAEAKEYKQVAGPSVSHVEKFLKREIGMNEKGFLTSVLIQQKQVDQIVSATPKERGIVIEELTGIASITHAITKANENTRGLEKAASIFQIGSLEETTEKVEKQKLIVSEISAKESEAIRIFKSTKEEFSSLEKHFRDEELKFKEKTKLTQEATALKRQVEFLKEQAKKDMDYINEFKEKNGSTLLRDPKQSKAELESKRSELYAITSHVSNLESKLKDTNRQIELCNNLKGEFTLLEDASESLNSLNKEIKSKEDLLEDLKSKSAFYTSEIKHEKASKEHISGEHTNCPVCKSPIEDAELIKNEIESKISELTLELKSNKTLIAKVQLEIKELKEKAKTTSISVEAIKELSALNENLKEIKSSLNENKTKGKNIQIDFESLEKEHEKTMEAESEKKALENAKKRSLTVYDNITELSNEVEKLNSKITELNSLSERSFNALIARVEETKNKVSRMSISGQEIVGRKKLENERLEDYERDLAKVKDNLSKYNELAKEIEISSLASGTLSEFKANRIDDAIPTLEFYASDFLSKFSGGAFSKISLDEKFNTFVTTSDGVVRPVAQLSGGELSSAAISLRLGIAMLLNSSDKNLLILDEVLVSMDEERARQIMEAISSMTNSQVIFIAHNTEVNSIADKTVLVESTKTKGE